MFRGKFEHGLDDKGRISIPVKFREILRSGGDDRLVITTYDRCLYAYPLEEFKKLEERAMAVEQVTTEDRRFIRQFFGSAMESSIDKLGRVLLPSTYREYAGIARDVVFLGVLTRIEIWSKERHDEMMGASDSGEVISGLAGRLRV